MKEDKEFNKKNKELAEYFFEEKLTIHCIRNDGKFFNGVIKKVKNNFFILSDLVLGNISIFYSELKENIEQFNKK